MPVLMPYIKTTRCVNITQRGSIGSGGNRYKAYILSQHFRGKPGTGKLPRESDSNYSKVYDCFNNHFPYYCAVPYLNLSPMVIDDSSRQNKISCYTSDPLTATIYILPPKPLLVLIPHLVTPNCPFP